MTTLKIIVEDEKADQLKQLLRGITFVKSVEAERPTTEKPVKKSGGQYEKLKKILESAKGKNLFKDIQDPSEWQRQIRKEWDRDF